MATNGYYKSTMHRVINPMGEDSNKPHFSLPLFLHPRPEVRLSEKHTAGSFLKERLGEIGLKR
jgi:isopenicillin N synthase-like dioxygenase